MSYTATLELRHVYTATLEEITPAMANYIINRYDLTGLTGGTAVKLDGIAESTLDGLSNGARVVVSLTHGDGEIIRAEYQLSSKGADVEAAPWIIVCDNDSTLCWRLDRGSVTKGGQPCVWNADSEKFHRVFGSGADGAALPAMDETGFELPT